MQIGRIVDLPTGDSPFAIVRDEYGSEYTVHMSELPENAEVGDSFAYKVDVMQNRSGNATTLKNQGY